MCQINNVLHNTGDKPLICYKVLRNGPKSINSSYFRSCSWKLGETKYSKSLCFYQSYIGSGFFHAFIDKVSAYQEQATLIVLDSLYSYIIAEMEIPPHTDYYTGETEEGIDSIATPVITFKQIL